MANGSTPNPIKAFSYPGSLNGYNPADKLPGIPDDIDGNTTVTLGQ
jgi:hypothetical protein